MKISRWLFGFTINALSISFASAQTFPVYQDGFIVGCYFNPSNVVVVLDHDGPARDIASQGSVYF